MCVFFNVKFGGKFCWYVEVVWLMIMIIYVSCEYVGGFGDDGDYKY